MGLAELLEISRSYGRNEEYVIAGGGNASFKDQYTLYVKPSGTTLAQLTEEGMVRMRRELLDAIWTKGYSRNPAERERQALADLLSARVAGEERRPSVETLLHELLRQPYVLHTHPALVNGLTCGKRGRRIAADLFPSRMLWIGVVNPGYVLASTVLHELDRHLAKGDAYPNIIFLENHGVFVAADSVEEIKAIYDRIMTNLGARVSRRPDFSEVTVDSAGVEEVLRLLRVQLFSGASGPMPRFVTNREIERFTAAWSSFKPLRSFAYTPDHIVYCGHEPMWVGRQSDRAAQLALLVEEIAKYRERNGQDPRVVAVERLGFFVSGENDAKVEAAAAMLLDAVKVAVYSESFGGPSHMPADKRDFIRSWEVESYRAKVVEGERKTEANRE